MPVCWITCFNVYSFENLVVFYCFMYNLFLEFDNDGNVENVYSIEVFLSRFLSLLFIVFVVWLGRFAPFAK